MGDGTGGSVKLVGWGVCRLDKGDMNEGGD